MLEQGQDVHEGAAAQQGRHDAAPGPPVFQHIVHEYTERCGNNEGQQRQHEAAGDHPGEHAP